MPMSSCRADDDGTPILAPIPTHTTRPFVLGVHLQNYTMLIDDLGATILNLSPKHKVPTCRMRPSTPPPLACSTPTQTCETGDLECEAAGEGYPVLFSHVLSPLRNTTKSLTVQ